MKLIRGAWKGRALQAHLHPDNNMEWTNHLERLADLRNEGYSVQKCAEEFNVRYGTMATVFSRYGIVSEEQKQLDKDRRLARKFALWGWTVADIAEQLDRCHAFVRKAIKGAFGDGVQLTLWRDDQYRVPPPPMRVVPRERRKPVQRCVQLSLFDGDQQLMAA